METHTISQSQWKSTFDSLSRVYDGSTASVEILETDLGAQFEVEDEPLRGISYDSSGIALHVSTHDGRHLVHHIAHPKKVQIEEDDAGLIAALDIASDQDPHTIVRFRSPRPSRLITGQA